MGNSIDGIEDRHEFREERRDCVGEVAGCHQENRHDRAGDAVERSQDRMRDRGDRLGKRLLGI